MATTAPLAAGFRKGSRVYWHGVFPDFAKQGTVMQAGKGDDLRQLVRWDGSTEAHLEYTGAIKKVNEHRTCACGRCGQRYADGPTRMRDTLEG